MLENTFKLFITTIISFTSNVILKYIALRKNIFLDNPELRKVHKKPIPRTGGLGLIISYLLGTFIFKIFFAIKILLMYLPILTVAIYEDLSGTSPKTRFLFMFISSVLAVFLLNSVIWNLGFFQLNFFIGSLLSILAIVGLTNAFNIIDGLNGLSSGLGILIAFTYAYLAYSINNEEIAWSLLIFSLSIIGFFVLNFPKGKVFLGDTGSYFIGFFLAITSILLCGNKNGEISPWVPMVLMFYPIWETLFSIFRRLREGKSPFYPDKKHLHHLLYEIFGKNHFKTTGIFLIVQSIISLLVLFFYKDTFFLIAIFIFLAIGYTLLYSKLQRKISTN